MKKTILITGGCGFIGTNATKYYLEKGYRVIIFDNLSRVGAKENLEQFKNDPNIVFIKGDIRDSQEILNMFCT